MPQEVVYDSCYYASTLLKIEVKNYKVVSIEFSDNAEEWMIKALNKIKDNGKINYNKFDSAIKKEGIKNCIFIFPTVIQSLFSCRNYFLRNDQFLSASVLNKLLQ